MPNRLPGTLLTGVLLLFAGCDNAPSTPVAEAPVAPAEASIDRTRFLPARELLAQLEEGSRTLLFDVRAKASYQHSHIRDAVSMPYGQFESEDVVALGEVTPDTPIVTYCGCPHHLAGLVADQLTEWGYRNVRVLHEGFWYWRDNGFPVVGAQAQSVTTLRFAGRLEPADEGTDVFISHARNGQLEAVAVDAEGQFETEFHVLGFHADDRFEVRVGSLESPVRIRLQAEPGRLNEIPAS